MLQFQKSKISSLSCDQICENSQICRKNAKNNNMHFFKSQLESNACSLEYKFSLWLPDLAVSS